MACVQAHNISVLFLSLTLSNNCFALLLFCKLVSFLLQTFFYVQLKKPPQIENWGKYAPLLPHPGPGPSPTRQQCRFISLAPTVWCEVYSQVSTVPVSCPTLPNVVKVASYKWKSGMSSLLGPRNPHRMGGQFCPLPKLEKQARCAP